MATSRLEVMICTYISKRPWKEPLAELLDRNGLGDTINVSEYYFNWGNMPDDKELGPKVASVDFLLTDDETAAIMVPYLFSKDCRLRFIQSCTAGANCFITAVNKQGLKSSPVPFARLGGFYGPIMAEYVIGHILAREREFLRCAKEQAQRVWNNFTYYKFRPLNTLTLGIIGLGDIGKEVARVSKAFGMTIWGLTKSPVTEETRSPHVDHYRQYDGLPELLASSDYVCSVLPSTPETRGLLDGDILKHCSAKKSVFINVGRGDVIDENTIARAIREGWLSGAILDVYQKEPLPSSSQLWDLPGVTITPHISALCKMQETLEFFISQIKRNLSNEPLQYELNWEIGY